MDGVTALMNAVRRGHERAVDVLLRHGAEVNTKDGKGRTALMNAAHCNHQPAVVHSACSGRAQT